jgi:tetratricopeptide (TPR) repeat protein
VGQVAVDRMLLQAVEHYDGGRPDQAEALCADILTAQPDHLAALHLSAVIAFVTDRAADGAKRLARVFSVDPDHAPALATLGDALAVKGEREGAVAAFERAVARRPHDASLHAKLGAALCDLSRFEEAEASLRRALALDPNLTQARFNLAVTLAGQKRLSEAEDTYRAVIARDPAYRAAWVNLGNVLSDQDKLEDAVAAYRQALTADPGNPDILRNLGTALRQQGRLEDAITCYRDAAALAPHDVMALRLLGLAQQEAGRLHEAVETYRKLSVLDPGDVALLNNLAACLCGLRQYDDALAACELALALNPHYAPVHTNRGVILEAKGDIEAAAAALRRAVEADPSCATSHANLAGALRGTGELDEALSVSHRAVELGPDDPLTRCNHAHFLLMHGDFENGFEELRWASKCKVWSHQYLKLSEPEWQGEPFPGRTLLLYSEQGFGDALQFVRYLPMVAARGGSVVLQVQPALVPLLRTMTDVTVVARGEEVLPPFDLQLPLMDLPRVFGTRLDTIPAPVRYLHPDPAKLARWRQALGGTGPLKVGVVWAGSATNGNDRQRSLAAGMVLPRLVMPGVQLYSLQKEQRPADAPVVAELGANIIDLAPALGDFTDTAAAVAALDLVITVDTSVAHLAGALGRPVWVLLPYALDWRWLRDREDSPWYPTMRLFRQKKQRVWDDVLARVPAELARVAAGERQLLWPPNHASIHTSREAVPEPRDNADAVVAALRRAVESNPTHAKGHAYLAVALYSAGQLDEALSVSHRAVALDPDDPLAHCSHGHQLLVNGDFKNGFDELRWGRKSTLWSRQFLTLSEPEWQGEPFPGRTTLLLYSEYGLGDVLQFVRYLPTVAAMGGSIVLQVQPALVSLLRTVTDATVVARGEALPPFDLQLPLMDLPRVFGTTPDTIPAPVPYLHPDPAKLARWRQALGGTTSLKVGVVWAGNPSHKGDRQRSLAASMVLPRLVMPGVQLYSLQKEQRSEDAPVLAELGANVIDLAPELGDFTDTAAAVAALDLVITVDTSVAHLAGALGHPVWVLLPYALDWRWLRDREDSPWYPTMRLFRQKKQQVWDDVLARVPAELARIAAGERQLLWPLGSKS